MAYTLVKSSNPISILDQDTAVISSKYQEDKEYIFTTSDYGEISSFNHNLKQYPQYSLPITDLDEEEDEENSKDNTLETILEQTDFNVTDSEADISKEEIVENINLDSEYEKDTVNIYELDDINLGLIRAETEEQKICAESSSPLNQFYQHTLKIYDDIDGVDGSTDKVDKISKIKQDIRFSFEKDGLDIALDRIQKQLTEAQAEYKTYETKINAKSTRDLVKMQHHLAEIGQILIRKALEEYNYLFNQNIKENRNELNANLQTMGDKLKSKLEKYNTILSSNLPTDKGIKKLAKDITDFIDEFVVCKMHIGKYQFKSSQDSNYHTQEQDLKDKIDRLNKKLEKESEKNKELLEQNKILNSTIKQQKQEAEELTRTCREMQAFRENFEIETKSLKQTISQLSIEFNKATAIMLQNQKQQSLEPWSSLNMLQLSIPVIKAQINQPSEEVLNSPTLADNIE